ncbi:glycosyltransferase family 2 protein [Arthrobacter mobilis]|uniref:Glycosyltransferase family 2 protein n=1 Tax=Arthrobacter mobilis TaxID=2724944 RepID=A0A7X6K560_9MICC|nr:glycosyltransferase family 2 protein [Arthrobacter mobilis]NKX55360.1 glycosyltransferase family 2 protein [Arthrobacter mobilis]
MDLTNTLAGSYDFSLPQLATALKLGPKAYEWALEDLADPARIDRGSGTQQLWHDNFVLAAQSLAQARRWLPLLSLSGKAHRVHLVLRDHPAAGPESGPPTVAQLRSGLMVAGSAAPAGYVAVTVSAGNWVDVHRAVAAALTHFQVGRPGSVVRGLRIGLTDPVHAAWAAGDPLARSLTPDMLEPEEHDIFPVDVLVAATAPEITSVRRPARIILPESGLADVDGWSTALPPVDVRSVSPRGFEPYPGSGIVQAVPAPDGGVAFDGVHGTAVLAPGEPVGAHTVAALRPHSYVDIAGLLSASDQRSASVVISNLAVAGIPMLAGPGSRALQLLGPDLAAAVTDFDAQDTPLRRESKSIDMRRLALDLFEPAARWARWVPNLAQPEPATVSVLLATRRADRVREAVRQIDRQSWPAVEIVLVLHGIELPDGELDRLRAECSRDLVVRTAGAEQVLGQVLNIGVAAASGELLAKMDDDDWYGRNHLRDLVQARRYSGADLVGSQVEFVYLEDLDILTRRPAEGERYCHHVAGGTMLISRQDLADLGGWRPVHRAVDRCLLQAVEAAGGSIYRGHGQNYVMHRYGDAPGHGGHTWAPEMETFLQNSSEQWDGFVLPPQIDAADISYRPPGRSRRLRSIFSAAEPELQTSFPARGEHS